MTQRSQVALVPILSLDIPLVQEPVPCIQTSKLLEDEPIRVHLVFRWQRPVYIYAETGTCE